MTHCVILAILLAQAAPEQTTAPVGRHTPSTVKVEGCKGQAGCIAIPVDIGVTSVSATTTCRATAAAPTYVEGTDDPVSCDLAGTLRTSASAGGGTDVTIHDPTVTTQKLAVDASGKIGINNTAFDITDRVGRALGVVSVTGSVAVTGTFFQATQPVSIAAALDISDRAGRLLGVTYGSQGQQLKQTATNFNLAVESFVAGSAIDPRSIRVLTSSDVVDISDRSARLLGHVTVDNASIAVTGTFWQSTQPVSIAAALDISDRVGRLLGHVTIDNSSIAVTGTFWQATQPVSGTFWQTTQPVSGTFWQATQPVSLAAAVDVSDRAARLVGKVRQTDGTLDLTLLNSAPASDTGQVAVPVRVVSQLGAGTGGGGTPATTMFNGTLVINPATGPVALPANTSKNVCIRNTKGSQDAVYFGSDANFSQYNAGGYVDPGEEDCEALASSATIFVFSPGGAVIYYRGVN